MSNISYFSNFPMITYQGQSIENLTLRAKFISSLRQNSSIYYPYIVADGEKADDIASWYYGSPEYDWIVYMTNDIINPYTDWPKSQNQFSNYITSVYGSMTAAQGQIAFYRKNPQVNYLQSDGKTISSTYIPGYQIMVNNVDIRITPESYAVISDQIDYFPVYAYDYEYEINENKRNIQLIDPNLKDAIVTQLKNILNNG